MIATGQRFFLVYTLDKGGMADLRAKVRPDHIEFMKAIAAHALIGGPLLDADGETRNGGMFLLKAGSLEQARSIAAQDPFARAGLFETVSVREWLWQTDNLP